MTSRGVPERILHVHNLPFNITAEEMYDLFGQYGTIRQIRQGTATPTKGKAFVVYNDLAQAKKACETLHGFNIGGRFLTVVYYHPRTQS